MAIGLEAGLMNVRDGFAESIVCVGGALLATALAYCGHVNHAINSDCFQE